MNLEDIPRDDIPTIGEWYQRLAVWQQILFVILGRMIGDTFASVLFGYHRAKREPVNQDKARGTE